MKYIKQHDERDCGAACLSMISCYYGLKYPLAKFRDLTKTDRNGTNLYGMVDAATKLNFDAEALNGSFEELIEGIYKKEITLPFIAHITTPEGMLHYVVIYSMVNNIIRAIDPDKGKVKYKTEEFINIWNGYIINLYPNEKFKKGNYNSKNLLDYFKFLKDEGSKIAGIIVISFIIAVIGILGSLVFEIVIDGFYDNNTTTGFHEHEGSEELDIEETEENIIEIFLDKTEGFVSENANHFNLFFTSLIALYILQALIQLLRGYLMALMAKNIDIKLVLSYYNHIIDLPLTNLQSRNTGEYLSRFSDASTIRTAISGATISLVMDSAMSIACGIVLYNINSKLFFVALLMIVLYAIIVLLYRKPIKSSNHKVMENNAIVESFLKESIDGVDTVKANLAENNIKLQNRNKFTKFINSVLKNNLISFSQDSVSDMIELVGVILILWIGFGMVINNVISVGSLLSFYALLAYFSSPIKNLIELQPMLQTAGVAAERLNDILKSEKEIIANSKNSKIEFEKLQIKNLNFRYGNHNLVLNNVNLEMHKGERIAIIGESGCGKTTLAKLLLKFYSFESGDILINGKSISETSTESIRSIVSYVDQNTFLFSDTIRNNLLLGINSINDETILNICKFVKLDDFIESLPLGLDSYLDENGRNLSGGQRQRISIARSLLRNPQILILDEATSNLDVITESAIKDTIEGLSKDISCIIIAHRLSTIRNCDKIAVMKDGTVVEFGCHDELIKLKGYYYNLVEAQSNYQN